MKRGKYEATYVRKRHGSKKALAMLLSLVLVIGCVVGGTLAWLTAESGEVKNVFTTSDIIVELKEHTYDPATDALTSTETTTGVDNYKMIPGWTIPKDPWAKVSESSEDCYLFIEVEASANFSTYMDYAIDTQWTALDATNYPGVYYIEIDQDSEKDVAYNILGAGSATYDNVAYTWTDDQVRVKPTVTKQMMVEAGNNKPTLSFTAYAVQLYKDNNTEFTPAEAWTLVSGS
ncbi:MAG: hypothetical protein IJX67_02160 [Oscillospiraceae bacterium]|nr:hypothetical protein [Oscillospiraceae bacterium]